MYTLVMAAFMITGGKIGQISVANGVHDRLRDLRLGSFTTAMSQSLPVLLFGWSLLEGLGAALILPAIVALVASNFAEGGRVPTASLRRLAVAVAAGPLIGGVATTYVSWRWVFVGEVDRHRHPRSRSAWPTPPPNTT